MRNNRPIQFFAAIAGAAAVLGLFGGQTQRPEPARDRIVASTSTIADAVGELPEELDLVVVVGNAAELRATPVGASAIQFLSDSGFMSDLLGAWKALAGELGWAPDETFDRLLGTRVILVSRMDKADPTHRVWALLSDVTLETEQRLKSRLKAAPRSIDQGHQILSIESGRFELTSHRRTSGKPGEQNSKSRFAPTDRVTLVFAPSDHSVLFDELVGMLSAGVSRPIRSLDVHQQIVASGSAEMLIALANAPATVRPGNQMVDSQWQDFVLLTGRRDSDAEGVLNGQSWKTRVLMRNVARKNVLRELEPSSSAPFDALAQGSLLTILQNTPLPSVLGSGTRFSTILAAVPIPEQARPLVGPRQAICIRTVDTDNRVSMTMAMQTNATGQMARAMDSAIPKAVQQFEQRMGVTLPAPRDYEGVAPNAARVVNLACSTTGPMSALTSRPLAVTWAYPSAVAVNGPLNVRVPSCTPEQIAAADRAFVPSESADRPGWWVFNISQESKDFVACDPALQSKSAASDNLSMKPGPGVLEQATGNCAQLAASHAEYFRNDANALLTADQDGEIARWVMLTRARPAALESILPPLLPDFRGLRSAMRRFEYVDARLKITDEGDILGSVLLRLADLRPAETQDGVKKAPNP